MVHGNISVEAKIITDATMPAGDYDLYLFMPDAYKSLAQRPEYAIRFANENMWDDATGYNNLNETVTIK